MGDGDTDLTLKVVVSENVNPDKSGRPSPIFIQVLELRDAAAFNAATYLDMYQNARGVLAADLVNTSELGPLYPGTEKVHEIELNTTATSVGLLGGFFQYRDVATTLLIEVEPGKDKTVNLLIDNAGIHLQ